ncbi:MAG: glycosyltransferase family 1 protein [bacterium]
MKIRVAIDARSVRPKATGVGRFTRCLIQGLQAANLPADFLLFVLRGEEELLNVKAGNFETVAVEADYEHHPRGDWWEQLQLPRLLQKMGVHVFHAPAYHMPWGAKCPPRVLSLHDLCAFSFPQNYSWGFRHYLRFLQGWGLRKAEQVIVPCSAMRTEVQRRFPGCSPKVSVVPYAPTLKFAPEDRRQDGQPHPDYFLAVGSIEPRKNPLFLARAYRDYCRLTNTPRPLMWVGAEGYRGKTLRSQVDKLLEGCDWKWLGWCGDDRLADLYRGAAALLFPSHYEGFGFPMVEALAAGCRVIASDIEVFRELDRGGTTLLTLDDYRAWAQAMANLPKDSMPHSDHVVRRWDDVAKEIFQVYEKAAQHRRL